MAGFDNEVVYGKNADFSAVDNQNVREENGLTQDGEFWIGHTALNAGLTHISVGKLVSPNNSINFGYVAPNITAEVNFPVDNDLYTARWIVSPTAQPGANYTSIQSAVNDASTAGGGTVFLRDGVFTQNVSLPPNVNLCSYNAGSTPTVTLIGTVTSTSAGSRTITGIRLQTNGGAFLVVGGAAANAINLEGCYLNCTNAVGISHTSSSSGAIVSIRNCQGVLAGASAALFNSSSPAGLRIIYTSCTNFGASTLASIKSAGTLHLRYSDFDCPIETQGTADLHSQYTRHFGSVPVNATPVIHGSTGTNSFVGDCRVSGGTSPAITIASGASLQVAKSLVSSSNSSVISGDGTLSYANLTFTGSRNISVANKVLLDSWVEVTGTAQQTVAGGQYVSNNSSPVVLTLPTSAAVGTEIEVSGKGSGGWQIAQNASQQIFFGTAQTSSGVTGNLASSHQRDAIRLVCITQDLEWNVVSSQGNILIDD